MGKKVLQYKQLDHKQLCKKSYNIGAFEKAIYSQLAFLENGILTHDPQTEKNKWCF